MTQPDPAARWLHALAGVALALLVSVLVAAGLARVLGDLLGDDYPTRVAIYGALLVYVIVGAALVVLRVAPHESRALDARRVLRWLVSLWLWPLLLRWR